MSHVDHGALKLFELVKKSDLEGLVVKRKDGKYAQQTLWYKVLNPTYTPERGFGTIFFRDSNLRLMSAVGRVDFWMTNYL